MLLALGTSICHQRFGIQSIGLAKNRPRDVDRIVKSKILDYLERRVVASGKLICEPNARCDFDVFRKPLYDFSKRPNLFFRILARN